MNSPSPAGTGAAGVAGAANGALAEPRAALGDDDLIAAAARGDRRAWAALVDRYLGPITGHAWYMLGDAREAEDIAQEAFIRLIAKAPAWEPGGAKLQTWLYRVVVNLCIDRRRKAVPTPVEDLPERADGGAEAADRGLDIRRRVREALDELPARQRAALVLTYYQGLTNGEAGEVLGIGIEAVESLLARSRRALKARLADVKDDLIGDVR